MNPLTRLYRRSRLFRLCLYALIIPFTFLVWVVSDDMWMKYSQVGDVILLSAFILFALWAWWYGEDRDRRRGRRASPPG